MSDAEFRLWLTDEVEAKRMSSEQRDDLLQQKDHFDVHERVAGEAHAR